MKCTYTSAKLIALAVLLLFTVTGIVAQEPPADPNEKALSGLSGKVVDTDGKPMSEFTFMVQPMQVHNGMAHPIGRFPIFLEEQPEDENNPRKPPIIPRAETDSEGAFSVTGIQPGPVQIIAVPKYLVIPDKKIDPNIPAELPQELRQRLIQQHQIQRGIMRHPRESEIQIVSIRLNKVTFFSTEGGPFPFGGLTFGLKPGVNIEDVKITVKKRLKIRAQIVYADGTPLANAQADLSMRFRGGEFGGGGGTHGTNCFTDAEGYFTQYRDEPGFYILTVKYKGFSGGAGPFVLKKDEHPEKLVIKLDGNPVVPKQPNGAPKKLDKEKARRFIKEVFVNENGGIIRGPIAQQPEKIVWIINPANGHAYAKIPCQGWDDAQRKAIAEGAHLVSINDEEEQFWLEVIYGNIPFWIGLNDVEKEGEWRWDSGEPVTYTNWTTENIFPDNSPDSAKDYVAISIHDRGWQSVSPNGHLWRMARHAVIEKDGLVSKIPEPAESEDE